MYTLNAIDIQRVIRGHLARRGKVRQVLEENDAARVITRALRTYVINKVMIHVTESFRRIECLGNESSV